MAHFVNNELAYAGKYSAPERAERALDSCRRFLKKHPNSFVKPNVFSYMLEMTAFLTTDTMRVFPLIDSVLSLDQMPTTRLRIGELLIEKEIDPNLGVRFLQEAFPHLSAQYHLYKAHLLLARAAIACGEMGTAKANLEAAVGVDSTRLEGWYAYLGYAQMTEQPGEAARISRKIAEVERRERADYFEAVENNALVGRSVNELRPRDLDGNIVSLGDFDGKVRVLQLFNFWCDTPRKEFPILKRMLKEFPQVKFIFMNHADTPEELRTRYFPVPSYRFLKDQTVVFPDSDYATYRFFNGGLGMGNIILIDKRGIARYSFPGMTKGLETVLRAKVQQLLREDR